MPGELGRYAAAIKTMTISEQILTQLHRIDARLPQDATGSAIAVLAHHVAWPDVAFVGSTERMRAYLAERGDGEDWSEYELQDEMPSLSDFRFVKDGTFWDGWEDEFASVDASKFLPFAADEAYFYFLTDNANDDSDPNVYSVDHEETDAEPYDEDGLTVSRLLSIIEPT